MQLGPDLVADGLHHAAASSTVPGVTSSSWSGAGGQHRRVGRGDERLPRAPHALGKDPAAAGIELREHVVEQEKRRNTGAVDDGLRLGEEKRKQREPLLSLRAEAAQVAAAGNEHDVVEVRPERRRAAIEITVESGCESSQRRRLPFVAERRIIEPQLGRADGEGRLEQGKRLEPGGDKLRAERRNAFAPRLDRVPAREACRCSAQRRVPLRHGRAVLRRQRRASRSESPENAVEVGAAGRRRPLHDAEAIRREDKRRDERSQLLGRTQRSSVQLGALAFTTADRHLELEPHVAAAARDRRSRTFRAEADDLRIRARAWRKPLRRDMDRFEQVRLPDAVRAHHEHEPRLQSQLEPLVRAEVAKLN